MSTENQKNGGSQDGSFNCSSCGGEFPVESKGKVCEKGKSLCIPCSLKLTTTSAADTSKEEVQKHKARVEASAEKREKGKGSRRLFMAILIFAIPVIAIEVFLMVKNKPASLTTADVAEIELSESITMITVLGQYYDEHGEYPPDLNTLVPGFWESAETEDLGRFTYTQIGTDNFRLERSGTSLPASMVSKALDQDLMPATMTADSNLDTYYDRLDEED